MITRLKMKQMTRFSIIFWTGILLLFSCQHEVLFDSAKWKQSGGENIILDTRKEMVTDLLKREILLHKTHNEIVQLIGSPVNYNNTVFEFKEYYPVQEKYGSDIDPKTTYLEVTFDRNGISEAVQLITSY